MPAHQPHGLPRRRPDGGLAETLGQLADHPLWRFPRLDDAGGEPKRPGRGGNQQRIRAGFVVRPVGMA